MGAGIEVYNEAGFLLVDSSTVNSRAVMSGTCNTGSAAAGYKVDIILTAALSMLNEVPLILIRPSVVNSYVGGCTLYRPIDTSPTTSFGMVQLCGQHPFDWIIFSAQGAPLDTGALFGLEVFDAGGVKRFSSGYKYPRLKTQFIRPITTYGWPTSYTVNLTAMPWLLANPLCMTWKGVSEGESIGCIMAAVSSGFTTVTFSHRDFVTDFYNYRVFPNLTDKAEYDPYKGRQAYFWIGSTT